MAKRDDDDGTREDMVLIRVTKAEKRLLTEAARYEGLGVSSWLRQLGIRAARKLGMS